MADPNLEKTHIDLEKTFNLITKIKKGIKQECCVALFDVNLGVSDRGFRIRIETRNYKTREYMYFQKTITEREIITLDKFLYDNLIDKLIKGANHFFRREQEKQNNANYCPCCDSHTCTCNAC